MEVYTHHKEKDATYNIKIRVTHNRLKRYLDTPYYITKDDLTQKTFKIKNQYYIDKTDGIIKKYRRKCDEFDEVLESMTIDQVVDLITSDIEGKKFDLDIVTYGRDLAKQLKSTGNTGNALTTKTL
ncbi:MAG: hypothetical protein LBU44_08340 [Mediterranea sp.]|nr:hypothetical protein [Mediterranea sp.]